MFCCACLSSRIELLQSAKVIAVFGFGCDQRPRQASVFLILDSDNARLLTETDRCLAGDSVCGAGRQGNRRKQRKTEKTEKKLLRCILVTKILVIWE